MHAERRRNDIFSHESFFAVADDDDTKRLKANPFNNINTTEENRPLVN